MLRFELLGMVGINSCPKLGLLQFGPFEGFNMFLQSLVTHGWDPEAENGKNELEEG